MIINHTFNWRLTIIFSVSLLSYSCDKTKTPSPQESTNSESTIIKSSPPKTTKAIHQEGSGTIQDIETLKKKPDDQAPDSTSKRTKSKETVTLPEIVTDPSTLNVDDGFPKPKPGDKIYTWDSIPNDACGEYWIKDSEGKISKVAVCRDQH